MTITKNFTAPFPICLARSALFSTAPSGHLLKGNDPFRFIDKEDFPIHPLRKPELTYTGPALTQYHALLWQALWHFAGRQTREHSAEPADEKHDRVVVASNALLRAMGRKYGDHRQRERVWEGLMALQHAFIKYKTPTHRYSGALIGAVGRQESEKGNRFHLLTIQLNPELHRLLSDEVVLNNLSRKAALGNDYLAMWLHDFIATWGKYLVIDEPVALVHKLSGSSLKLPQFRQRLRKALDVLAQQDDQMLVSWSIDKLDNLRIEKVKTKALIMGQVIPNKDRPMTPWEARKAKEIDDARNQRAGTTT